LNSDFGFGDCGLRIEEGNNPQSQIPQSAIKNAFALANAFMTYKGFLIYIFQCYFSSSFASSLAAGAWVDATG
jgi:hypothetical protein